MATQPKSQTNVETVTISKEKVGSKFKAKVNKPEIHLYPGDTVEWRTDPEGQNFTVNFDKDGSPFYDKDPQGIFDQNHNTSKHMITNPTGNKPLIFNYTVTIDGADPLDPRVIIH